MSEIRLVRRHSLPMAVARALAERAVDDFAARYDAATQWRGDVLRFRARGAAGEVRLSRSEIRIGVKLGLWLAPFKARIAGGIEEQLDRLLGAAGG